MTSTLSESNAPWRVGLSYKPSSDANYYFNVTKGYKAGIYPTVPGLIPSQFEPIKQESIACLRGWVQKAIFGNKLRASGAAFYYDYSDKQILGYINTFLGNLPGLISIPKGEIKGAELQLDIRPLSGLNLTVGGTYIDSKVKSDFIGNDPLQNAVNFKGEAFQARRNGNIRWMGNMTSPYQEASTPSSAGLSPIEARRRWRSATTRFFWFPVTPFSICAPGSKAGHGAYSYLVAMLPTNST